MEKIQINKDAFVGVHNIDGIECRILIVFPDLRLYAWRLDKPELVVFGLKEKEEFDINPEDAGFHLDNNGIWVKPNGDSVVVFYNNLSPEIKQIDHVFEKYFPVEHEKHNRLMEEISDKYGYRVGETEEEWVKKTSR